MRGRKYKLSVALSAALSCALAGQAAAAAPPGIEGLAGTYAYLVSLRDPHGGALYRVGAGALQGAVLPYSFSDSARYWGEYVCELAGVNCTVADYYDPGDFGLKARGGAGASLQAERVDVHNGTNIYDAATWQIAVVLGAVANHFTNALGLDPYQLAANENRALARAGGRAITHESAYLYNGARITTAASAYAFRMSAPAWLVPDPLKDSPFAHFITVGALPGGNPLYTFGQVSWSDWKPITGDNAWAFLVGPLQAAYLHYVVAGGGKCVPFAEPAVQNALAVLRAFAAMQSAGGAVYYAPAGTSQNQGAAAVSPYFVSIENNLSLLAGLRILEATLAGELTAEAGLTAEAKNRIASASRLIDAMLSGGALPDARHTRGLREFLRTAAWRQGEFVTAGFADEPGAPAGWRPILEPRAVDVNTWGVAALGARQIDAWFGFGTAYQLWERLKDWGAYGEGQTLEGVGYSDADSNGRTPEGNFRAGVLSAEWTAGAIVMVRNMIQHYGATPAGAPLVAKLAEDEARMLEGLQQLRLGRYVAASVAGKPPGYAHLIAEPAGGGEPYLYASRRYFIPFGWYGNPLPSTAASAWVILIADRYDPFGYAGKPNP